MGMYVTVLLIMSIVATLMNVYDSVKKEMFRAVLNGIIITVFISIGCFILDVWLEEKIDIEVLIAEIVLLLILYGTLDFVLKHVLKNGFVKTAK